MAASAKSELSVSVEAGWTFLTNHSHVLLCLAEDAEARVRDVADRVGITERAVQKILQDLETAGVIERQRSGRRNHYTLHADHRFHHPIEAHCRVNDLLRMVLGRRGGARRGGA